ncbi:MAG: hypothetical protein K8E66_08670, partial [Phycisphaerales bacterium]|nr:hypothetical protein [Phycisphaerales bacterium]
MSKRPLISASMPVLDVEACVIKNQTQSRIGPGSKSAALVWSAFAFASVVAMIGLGPARPSASGTPGHTIPINTGGLGWTDTQFNNCHSIEPAFSHPVVFSPGRSLPDRFPLQDGRMTCLTCHDGAEATTHSQARQTHAALLRSPFEGQAFCAECHEQSPFSSGMGHAGAVTRAHLIWPEDGLDRDVRTANGGLD